MRKSNPPEPPEEISKYIREGLENTLGGSTDWTLSGSAILRKLLYCKHPQRTYKLKSNVMNLKKILFIFGVLGILLTVPLAWGDVVQPWLSDTETPLPSEQKIGELTEPRQMPETFSFYNGSVPEDKYNLYRINTSSGSRLRLAVVNNSREFDLGRILSQLNQTSREFGLVSDDVTGHITYIEGVRENGYAKPLDDVFWSEPLDSPIHIHEYVHTGQNYATSKPPRDSQNMLWIREGEADYYALYVSQRIGSISLGEYNGRMLSRYVRSTLYNQTLVNLSREDLRAAGGTNIQYKKGSVVFSALDREIRQSTGSNKTVLNLSYEIRDRRRVVTRSSFNSILEDVAGKPMKNWTEDYVEGKQTPFPHLRGLSSPVVLLSTLIWARIGPVLTIVSFGGMVVLKIFERLELIKSE